MTEELDYIVPQLRDFAVPVSELTPDPKNARRHDRRNLDSIIASIKASKFRSLIVVQRKGDELIVRAGNGRVEAMKELGHEFIPALVFDEGDDEAVQFAIADNRTAELAEWDFEALGENLAYLKDDVGVDMSTLGFTETELEMLTTDQMWAEASDEDLAQPEDDREDLAGSEKPESVPKVVITGEAATQIRAAFVAAGTEQSIDEWVATVVTDATVG